MLKVNNRDTRTRCEICSKLTIKTPERCNFHGYITAKLQIVGIQSFQDTKHTRKAIIYQCFFNRMVVTLIHKTGKKMLFLGSFI